MSNIPKSPALDPVTVEALEVVISIAERYTPKDMVASLEAIQEAKDAIRSLLAQPSCASNPDTSTDCNWRTIDTAPHEVRVLLGWDQMGTWFSETGMASHGWRRNGISNMSRHGFATHWMPIPEGPVSQTVQTCKKCGIELNGEAAQVDNEIWCHSCADTRSVSETGRTGGE